MPTPTCSDPVDSPCEQGKALAPEPAPDHLLDFSCHSLSRVLAAPREESTNCSLESDGSLLCPPEAKPDSATEADSGQQPHEVNHFLGPLAQMPSLPSRLNGDSSTDTTTHPASHAVPAEQSLQSGGSFVCHASNLTLNLATRGPSTPALLDLHGSSILHKGTSRCINNTVRHLTLVILWPISWTTQHFLHSWMFRIPPAERF
jgi:hypothetical protein